MLELSGKLFQFLETSIIFKLRIFVRKIIEVLVLAIHTVKILFKLGSSLKIIVLLEYSIFIPTTYRFFLASEFFKIFFVQILFENQFQENLKSSKFCQSYFVFPLCFDRIFHLTVISLKIIIYFKENCLFHKMHE